MNWNAWNNAQYTFSLQWLYKFTKSVSGFLYSMLYIWEFTMDYYPKEKYKAVGEICIK